MASENDPAGLGWRADLDRSVEEELVAVRERHDAVLKMQQAIEQAHFRLSLEARTLEQYEKELFDLYADLAPPEPSDVTARGDDVSAPPEPTQATQETDRRYSRTVNAAVLGHLLSPTPFLN